MPPAAAPQTDRSKLTMEPVINPESSETRKFHGPRRLLGIDEPAEGKGLDRRLHPVRIAILGGLEFQLVGPRPSARR